jgi:hypothetical protein
MYPPPLFLAYIYIVHIRNNIAVAYSASLLRRWDGMVGGLVEAKIGHRLQSILSSLALRSDSKLSLSL